MSIIKIYGIEVSMRYYIYIDRLLLRTLFSIDSSKDFDIEIIDYSVRKNYTKNNQFQIRPNSEKISQNEDVKEKDQQNRKQKCVNINKNTIGAGYDHGNSYSVQTERRYINVDDISDMKNCNFYHNLIEKIKEKEKENNSRIKEEKGYISLNINLELNNTTDEVFKINDSYVWIDTNNLQGNLSLYSKFLCLVNVVGYKLDCPKNNFGNIYKAIAIYIE